MKALTLQEVFLASITDRRPVALSLASGFQFHGQAVAVDGESWVIDTADGRAWIDSANVAALTISEAPPPRREFTTELKLNLAARIEFQWSATPAPAAEVSAAWRMLTTIAAALEGFPKAGERIRTIRMVSSHAGRFRIDDGVLEAGFTEDESPPSARELQSLLAMIL